MIRINPLITIKQCSILFYIRGPMKSQSFVISDVGFGKEKYELRRRQRQF